MYKHAAFLLLLVFGIGCAVFKKNNPAGKYFHGFIYYHSGDSLEGRIKVKPIYDNDVVIKPDSAKGKISVPIERISDLKINLIHYGPVTIDGKLKLLEKVAYGTFNLYAYNQAYKDQLKTYYYFEISPSNVVRLTRENYLEILEEHLIGVRSIELAIYDEEVTFSEVINLVRRYNSLILKN